MITGLLEDLRGAGRSLRHTPGFTTLAVIALALGVGPTLALFSVVHSILIRPLPYPEVERIVYLGRSGPAPDEFSPPVGYEVIERLQGLRSVELVSITDMRGGALVATASPQDAFAMATTAPFLSLFGPRTVAGRLPDPQHPHEALISSTYWRDQFGSTSAALGQVLEFEGRSFTIVGVLRPDFFPQLPAVLWYIDSVNSPRVRAHFDVFGRIAPGETEESVRAELAALTSALEQDAPGALEGRRLDLMSFRDSQVGFLERPLLTFSAAIAFVVLIACANVANLLLARGTTRGREIAVRRALGASRLRLVRHLFTEAFVLAIAGGFVGLLVAWWLTPALLAVTPLYLASFAQPQLSGAAVAFAVLLVISVSVLFGTAPAWWLSGASAQQMGQEHASTVTRGPSRPMRFLVLVEVALATVLLVSASFLIASFMGQLRIAGDITTEHVAAVRVTLPQRQATTGRALAQALADHAEAAPGVQWAEVATRLPLFPALSTTITMAGGPPVLYGTRAVTPGYFHQLGIPLVVGRAFTARDREGQPEVAIVNETMAGRVRQATGREPVGTSLLVDDAGARSVEIVGVVRDLRATLGSPVQPEVYTPLRQTSFLGGWLTVIGRVSAPRALADRVRRVTTPLAPNAPVSDGAWLEDELMRQLQLPRFRTTLLATSAGLGLLVAVVGVLAIVAYTVAQRTRDIAVRLALGARSKDIIRTVTPMTGIPVAAGLLVGTVVATQTVSLLRPMLFEISAQEVGIYAVAVGVFALSAAAGTWLPLRRALRVNPADVLRHE